MIIKLFEQFANENAAKSKAIKIAQQFQKDHHMTITGPDPNSVTVEGDEGTYYGICDEGKYVFQWTIDNVVVPNTKENAILFVVPDDETLGISNGDAAMYVIDDDEIDGLESDDYESCMYKLSDWKKVKDLREAILSYED